MRSPNMAPLVGTVVKTICLRPYTMMGIAEAIRLGNYNEVTFDIGSLFAPEQMFLRESADVHLVRFDQDPSSEGIMVWEETSGKKLMRASHTLAIGIQCPEEQRRDPIIGLGSVRSGTALCLDGNVDWRRLVRVPAKGQFRRRSLFGFTD